MTKASARIRVAALFAVLGAVSMFSARVATQGRGGGGADQANVPTPRTADGHPDLSGYYGGSRGGAKPDAEGNIVTLTKERPCSRTQRAAGTCAQAVNFERDSGLQQRATANVPMYK